MWRRCPEALHGFLTRQDAIDWLELASQDKVIEENYNRWDGKYHDPHLRLLSKPGLIFTIRPMGIIYHDGPTPDSGSAWHMGILRALNGQPMPEGILPPQRSKFRVRVESGSASGCEYIVEF